MKNTMIFYNELKNCSKEVQTNEITLDAEIFIKAMDVLIWLSHYAMNEGFLALEMALNDNTENICDMLAGLPLEMELKKMIKLVGDGEEPEYVEDICFKRYFSRGYGGMNALFYLIYMDSMMAIEEGKSPFYIEKSIEACIPEKYQEAIENYFVAKEVKNNTLDAGWEKIIAAGAAKVDDSLPIGLADYALSKLPDTELAKIIEGLDENGLAFLVKALSGKTIKSIYKNMEAEKAERVLELYDYSGPVRMLDIEDEAGKVLTLLGQIKWR